MGGGEAVERDNKQDALKWDKNCFYIKKGLKERARKMGISPFESKTPGHNEQGPQKTV